MHLQENAEAVEKGEAVQEFELRPGNLQHLRSDPDKHGAFKAVVTLFFAGLYGRHKWKKKVDEKRISDFVHPSTEALFLLSLENSYSYWRRWAEEW